MKQLFLVLLFVPAISSAANTPLTVSTQVPRQTVEVFENLDFDADLRLRNEHIEEPGREPRDRQRLRARLGVKTALRQDIQLGFRVATGGDSVTSTNEDLGDGFSTKDFGIDLAYANWKASPSTNVVGGKMKIPFFRPSKSQIIWDSDVTPEGAALQFNQKTDKNGIFSNIGAFTLEERSSAENAALFAGQLGYDSKKRGWGQFKAGVSAYIFTGIEGQDVVADSSKSFGNSVSDVGIASTENVNETGFEVYEAFAEYKAKIGAIPVSIGADVIVNGAVSENNTGYIGIVTAGSKKGDIPVVVGYNYRRIEADATLGSLTDSDAFGGGTNGRGHLIYGNYHFSKAASVGTSLFLTQVDLDNPEDYLRGMVDFKVAY